MSGSTGWQRDPFGLHEWRYFQDGKPTSYVGDAGLLGTDDPPAAGPADLQSVSGDPRLSPARGPALGPFTAAQPVSGTALVGRTWRVIVRDPALIGWALLGAVASFVVLIGTMTLLLSRLPTWNDLRFPHYLVLVPAGIVASVPSTFTNSVVLLAADQQLRGQAPDYSAVLRRVASRAGVLVMWALLAGIVGAAIQLLLERVKIGGRIITWLVGLSWAAATSFVVPCIVFEELGVGSSIRRSAHLFKARWGLNVRARLLTGGIGVAIGVTIGLVGGVAVALSHTAGLIIFFGLIVAFGAAVGALQTVLTSALYRYTVDGVLVGDFTEADFVAAFWRRR